MKKGIRIGLMIAAVLLAAVWCLDIAGVQLFVQSLLPLHPGAGFMCAAVAVGPFPVDPEMTSVAVAYKKEKLIADNIFPRVPVGVQNFKYKVFSLADSFTIQDTTVGRTSAPNVVDFGFTEVDSSCIDQALDGLIPQVDIENAPAGYDPFKHKSMSVMDLVLLKREQRAAALAFDANNYAASCKTTLAGASQWSHADSDPIAAILTALDAMVMRANKLLLGQTVWTKLRQHTKVIKATNRNSGDAGVAARQAVAELLELDEIIVGSGWYNSAAKGQSVTKARLWGNKALLFFQDGLADVTSDRVTYGMTAQFGSRFSGKIADSNVGYRGGFRTRTGESVREIITANDLGYLFTDAVA